MKLFVDCGIGGLPAAAALCAAAPDAVAACALAPDCANPEDARAALCAALPVTVCRGAVRPTLRDTMPTRRAPRSISTPPPCTLHAVDVLARMAQEGPCTVLCLGPLTNLALALLKYPALAKKITRVIAAGGAQLGYGGATRCAQYNIYCDPEAARTVTESGVPLTFVPEEAAENYYYAAAALALDNAAATKSYSAFVDIDVSGSASYGQTVFDPIGRNPITGEEHGGERVTVVSAVDEDLITRLLGDHRNGGGAYA